MNDILSTIRNMGWNLTHRLGIIDIIDILIVAVIIYELLLLTRHTRGSALLKGLFLLLLIVILSNLLGLTSLNWLLLAVLQNGALVLVILFQPELRKALERMGSSRLMTKGNRRGEDDDRETIIAEIVQTVVDLSRRKVGALIVFERKTGLQDVVENGTALNADISAPLLENIFEPNTPLHDATIRWLQPRAFFPWRKPAVSAVNSERATGPQSELRRIPTRRCWLFPKRPELSAWHRTEH